MYAGVFSGGLMKSGMVCALSLIACAAVIFLSGTAAHAEAVFLKNGSIVEGKILRETGAAIELQTVSGPARTIKSGDILRTLYDDAYKELRFVSKKDGSSFKAYLVDEDRDSYTFRPDLLTPAETKILKKDILGVSKKKEETAEDKITSRASLVRAAANLDMSGRAKNMFSGGLLDLMLYRARNTDGNGADFFIRGQYNAYKQKHPESLGLVIPPAGCSSDLKQGSFGAGFRGIYGTTFLGCQFQGYALGYYQFTVVSADIAYNNGGSSITKSSTYSSHGIVGGAGLEISPLPYFGAFVEYTLGYSPAFPKDYNLESGTIRVGLTVRTGYL
jgi:hypothetical protein